MGRLVGLIRRWEVLARDWFMFGVQLVDSQPHFTQDGRLAPELLDPQTRFRLDELAEPFALVPGQNPPADINGDLAIQIQVSGAPKMLPQIVAGDFDGNAVIDLEIDRGSPPGHHQHRVSV